MKRNLGYTLIELVVVAGLVGLLSIGLVNLFTSSVRGSQRARLQAEVKSQGDFALASMERQIRNATELPELTDGVLSFSVPGVDDPQKYEIADTTINFNGGSLFSSPVMVTNATLEPVEGEGLSPGEVKISFTLTATEGNLTVEQAFQSTVALRNIK